MNEFEELLRNAKQGKKEAKGELWNRYQPLVRKLSRVDGRHSEDLYQELSLVFFKSIERFNPDILVGTAKTEKKK